MVVEATIHSHSHSSTAPHLEVDQELRALEVARCHTDIVLLVGVVKFCQSPVNQSKLQRTRSEAHKLI